MVAELDRLEYENAKMIIANTEVVKENIVRYYDVDKSIIHVIPNGVFPKECNFDRPSKKAEECRKLGKQLSSQIAIMLRPASHIRYHIAAILAAHWIQFVLQY